MKKIKTLLVLSGLAVSILAGCNQKTTTQAPSTEPTSTEPTSAPTSEPSSTSSTVVKTLESIRIASEPTKKNYFVGDQFDAAGLVVNAVYNTGEEVVAAADYQLSGFDSSAAGEKTITVTFQGKTATFKVNVAAIALSDIAIVSEPTKKSYRVGDEFDPAGLSVKAIFNNGSEQVLAADAYQLSGFDSLTGGLKTITVTYEGKTATFSVSVIGRDGLAIVSAPAKVNYAVGDEFDPTGLVVAQKYEDGSTDELAATDYTLDGFESTTVGEKTITVAYDNQTVTFPVNVYKADWTAAEKASMNGEGEAVLIYPLPYYLSFELEQGGLYYTANPEEKAVEWIEARTAFEVTEDDLEDYRAQIEAIKTSAGKQAWNPFETTGSSSKYTDDVDFLGFDDASEVYQYARWYNDQPQYIAFQVISIGLDPAGKLLAVSTLCIAAYSGYGVDGGGYRAMGTDSDTGEEFDMVKELCGIADERAAYAYDDADKYGITFSDCLVFPAYSQDTVVFYMAKHYDSPYIYSNVYSKEYDMASCEFQLTNKYAENEGVEAYTEDDLEAILDVYRGRGIEVVEDSETYNVTVYDMAFNYNGWDLKVEYYYVNEFIIIDVDVLGFEIPYRSDIYLGILTSSIAAYAEKNNKTFQEMVDGPQYNESIDGYYDIYFVGYGDNANTGFINGIGVAERSLVTAGIRQSGLLTAAEVNALEWVPLKGFYAGTANVNGGANTQYQLVAENTLQFVEDGKSYTAVYDAENKTLQVTIQAEEGDPVVVNFAADEFTAASGTDNDPFAGTWENADLKLKLSKSKIIYTQQGLTFTCVEKDGKVMKYTIMLQMVFNNPSQRYIIVCQIVCQCVDAPAPAQD